jgi:hypothetical protein
MPTFEGSVLRVYRLPIIVEAVDAEDARRKIEKIYRGMRSEYDGSQDLFEGHELPAKQWPIEIMEDADPVGCDEGEIPWSSWAI